MVFSGDTRYLPALAEFAKNTDVLVHEVMYLPALQRMLKTNDNAPTLLDHLLKSHSTSEEVGMIAAAANAKMLVLNHFVPGAMRPSPMRCGAKARASITPGRSWWARI